MNWGFRGMSNLQEEAVMLFLWEYDYSVQKKEDLGNFVQPFVYDFHMVGGLIENGLPPSSIYSKNGNRPIYGPAPVENWIPSTFERATYSEPAERPGLYPGTNSEAWWFRTNIRLSIFVIPTRLIPNSFYND